MDESVLTLKDLRGKTRAARAVQVRKLSRRKMGKLGRLTYCELCRYSKHVEVHHKKAIKHFPEDTLLCKVNNLGNLIALCPNCHWELDNGLLDALSTV